MKKKLRTITVNEQVYFYSVLCAHCDDDIAIVTVKIYLAGQRHTPYMMHFRCLDDFYRGASLYGGVSLLNVQTGVLEYVTLNRPYFIRLCILKALEQGWEGSKMQINSDGMQFLAELSFDLSMIIPPKL